MCVPTLGNCFARNVLYRSRSRVVLHRLGVRVLMYYSGGNRLHSGYTHSLSPSRPPNNTLNTQNSAQQTHSRSRLAVPASSPAPRGSPKRHAPRHPSVGYPGAQSAAHQLVIQGLKVAAQESRLGDVQLYGFEPAVRIRASSFQLANTRVKQASVNACRSLRFCSILFWFSFICS